MLELTLCSMLTILPDYLFRRFVQGKRFGREITLFTVWYELRWGITLCLLLTITLITTIFYFHPATTAVNSVFRTVTILPETSGRVPRPLSSQPAGEGGRAAVPARRCRSSRPRSRPRRRGSRNSRRRKVGAVAQLAQAEAGIAQARANLRQAQDEYDTRAELLARGSGAVSVRDVEQALVRVQAQEAALAAAEATRDAVQAQLDIELPARVDNRPDRACRRRRWRSTARWSWRARTASCSSSRCAPATWSTRCSGPPASSCPSAGSRASWPASGRSSRGVMKVGMIGEVTCLAKPLTDHPDGGDRDPGRHRHRARSAPTDQLVGVEQFSKPGTITVLMEPLYEGAARRPAAGLELHRQRLHQQLRGAAGPEHQLVPRLRAARHRRHRARPRDDPADAGADAADADAGVLGRALNDHGASRDRESERKRTIREGQDMNRTTMKTCLGTTSLVILAAHRRATSDVRERARRHRPLLRAGQPDLPVVR